jgi:hypothetical protein
LSLALRPLYYPPAPPWGGGGEGIFRANLIYYLIIYLSAIYVYIVHLYFFYLD